MDMRSMEFAHDLKMPIQLIYSCVQLLEMEMQSNARAEGYLKLLSQSADQLQAMLRTVLEGEAAPRMDRRDVAALARSVGRESALLAREQGIELRFQANPRAFLMNTDAQKLQRILENLISNALRFTPRGGRISLEFAARGDSVEFIVSDTGCGISKAQQARIFQPGETTDSTGYGLHIVQKYTQELGGTIRLNSIPNNGSQFTICLPVIS